MRLAVLFVFAACAGAARAVSREESNEPLDKPGYGPTEAPDKQVEYVTGPNVGIVGPTVLGGKGQEVQPSGEELRTTDKEQRDVASQYSGYQQVAAEQVEDKEQVNGATYPKYSYTGEGVKYIQRQESKEQAEKESLQNKNQVVQIGNSHGPTKVTYYQSGESYQQPIPNEQRYYIQPVPQNQELSSAQLLARLRTHELSQLLNRGPPKFEKIAAQSHGQEERRISQSHAEKTDAAALSSQEAQSAEDHRGQQVPSTNASPVYIPQEYLQYQIAVAHEDLQSTLQSPGKHLLQLFLPQEATGGNINEAQQPQVAPLQSNLNLQPIQNGHQIQYIPAYYPDQSPLAVQKAQPNPESQNLPKQIIRTNEEVSQPATNIQNPYSSSAVIPPTYQRPQLHPQLYSNFQPSHHQPQSPFSNVPTQYHLLHQSNDAVKRPQKIYHQNKQTAQPTQHAQKPIASKPSYIQSHNHPTIHRPKTPERLPQRQPENLALVSQSPPKTTQHRQTHDKPPQHQQPQETPQELQSYDRPQALQHHDRPQAQPHQEQQTLQPQDRPQALQHDPAYQTENIQPTHYKLSPALQNNPYAIQKLQSPLQNQSPTPFPVKVFPFQPQAQIPLTYQLPSQKDVAFRPIIYPVATPFGQAVQTEAPLSLLPTEAAKLYNVKVPSFIKTLEQVGHSKPFGFSQMSYGQSPGSYSYSIFNKHS